MEIKYDVFISYSRHDKKIAEGICGYLESNGLRCFIDYRDIPRSAVWARVIPDALRSSGMMVAIFSAHYNESLQVERELSIADKAHIPVLPFRIADIPFAGMKSYYFESINWLDAFPDPEKMFGDLLTDILALKTNSGNWITNRSEVSPVIHTLAVTDDTITDEVITQQNAYNPEYEDDYAEGVDSMKNHEYADAVELLLESALANYKDSQRYISWMMDRDTIGMIPKRLWPNILKVADQGNAFAQYMTSRYYSMINVDSSQSFEYASLSARQGSPYGRYALAKLYELGEGVEVDDVYGIEKLKELERLDFPMAMREMARENIYGYTLRKSNRKGIRILKRGIDLGFTECLYEMGKQKLDATSPDYNLEEGRSIMTEAYNAGFPLALDALASSYYMDIIGGGIAKDIESNKKALELLNKGIRMGNPTCMYSLAWLYKYFASEIGLKKNDKIVEKWCRKAAEYYNRSAASLLGEMYYYGSEEIEENNPEAWKWYNFAAERHDSWASYKLGIMCLEGYAQDGMDKSDSVNFFEEALYIGGGGAGYAALNLYRIYAPNDFEQNFPTTENLQSLLDIQGCEKDVDRAIGYLRRGMNFDDNTCRYILGCALTDLSKPYADEIEGVDILKEAISSAFPCYEAALRLYEIYTEGIGVIADEELAEYYLKEAKDHLSKEVMEKWDYKPYKIKLLESEASEYASGSATAQDLIKAMSCLSKASAMGGQVWSQIDALEKRMGKFFIEEINSAFPDYTLLARMCYGEEIIKNELTTEYTKEMGDYWKNLTKSAYRLCVMNLRELSYDLKEDAIELMKCWRQIYQKAAKEGISLQGYTPIDDSKILDYAEQLFDTEEEWSTLLLEFEECNIEIKQTLIKARDK